MSRTLRLALVPISLAALGTAWALQAMPLQLESIVPLSDLIVVGTVTASEPGKATVKVTVVLKGHCADAIQVKEIHEWKSPGQTLPPKEDKLFCLQRGKVGYLPVGSDRFLEGIRDPREATPLKPLVAHELWGESGKDGLRLCACPCRRLTFSQ